MGSESAARWFTLCIPDLQTHKVAKNRMNHYRQGIDNRKGL